VNFFKRDRSENLTNSIEQPVNSFASISSIHSGKSTFCNK
jgi:hypothetical protein